MLFSKKIKYIKAPATGTIIPIEQIPDTVFSAKMMGNGFAIANHNGKVYSPVTGIVQTIFSTKHAIVIKTKNGPDILIHMGIDTVDLNGVPFKLTVKNNQQIKTGDLLAVMDLAKLKEYDKEDMIIVILVDMQEGDILESFKIIEYGENVFRL
ncbi:hypothetical protein A5886_002595 [Enterococcus sp. 8G7_MSG3316]|uniref:PTS EIIA type-1 domain-containing protein n=1 Tax=Candidatus Enterococcus testudinis TaxID=1834191 RepID=A0A242A8Y4_9ENTE|nr:PTS glucose transporter subunit IIA [Enterococcus sp. 8G7_MSG3316]OTN77495.1 hypothetical protein A5886_002595 [Enterococcus sp. 8G7_MSG3316]